MNYFYRVERLKGIIALVLLAVLSFSFFPIESLHHHEGELSICKNADTHFDEHAVACDLCDFLLQEYTSEAAEEELVQSLTEFKYQEASILNEDEVLYFLPQYRGPPIKV